MKEIEIWADSFHEGVWCCNNICKQLMTHGYTYEKIYMKGFIPCYTLINKTNSLKLIVYGSYKSWNPIPQKIKNLIDWGKPDFIAYDAKRDEILFAVEETAATPTGNQAMQRCERQYGCAHLKIPYWYFVSEYGEHVDGGIRRDNIWPSIAAIKLTMINRIPCIVLHYSDIDNIEDYNAGKGLGLLFSTLSTIIDNCVQSNDLFYGTNELIIKQYQEMLDFISSQWNNVIDFIPSLELLNKRSTAQVIADFAFNIVSIDDLSFKRNILAWPLTTNVPKEILNQQNGKPLIKYDKLAELLEMDVSSNKCYILSNNAGSGKPTSEDKIKGWIEEQKKLFVEKASSKIVNSVKFNMKIEDFPRTDNGNIHITTSKNIVYLYDKWSDLRSAIEKAYPRLKNKLNKIPDNAPVFLYVSNSLKPGRLFGDPYTGQLSAYSTCFGKFDQDKRFVIVYFPHQVYTQAFNSKGEIIKNKGTTLYKELTDYLIFNEGIVVSLKDQEII